MHLPTSCGILGLLMAVLLHVAVTFPVDESVLAQRESYLAADEVFGPELKERGEREKRKGGFLEPVVEATFGVKSRVIGLIFGKINQLIDAKHRYVDQLDRKNIELNRRVIANQNCITGTELVYPPVPAVPNKVALLAQLSSSKAGLISSASSASSSGSSSPTASASAPGATAPDAPVEY